MINQADRVRLVNDVVADSGTVHREGEKADVVGFRGFTHAVIVFSDGEYALAPIEDLVTDHNIRRKQ